MSLAIQRNKLDQGSQRKALGLIAASLWGLLEMLILHQILGLLANIP